MTVRAIVVRQKDDLTPEVLSIEFPDGIAGWTKWTNDLSDHIKKVEAGGHYVDMGEHAGKVYDTDTQANTIAYLLGSRRHLVAWNLSDMAWLYLKSKAESQPRENFVGRPASLIQPLQTWRKWAKKAGAVL